jgi:hypothetical protein
MAKVRSPNYPVMDLGAALEAVRPAWKAENRNKMSKKVLAGHMGYTSLNGRALGRIGAVRAYGLIDGSGDELRISDDAITALASPDKVGYVYKDALKRLAFKPQVFQDIQKQFPASLPSEQNLSFWLVQQNFTQDAAGKAAKTFLATMRLVYGESGDYSVGPVVEELAMPPPAQQLQDRASAQMLLDRVSTSIKPPAMSPSATMLQEVFNLDEGPVTLTFPSNMTPASYDELDAALKLFLMRAKRRAHTGNIDLLTTSPDGKVTVFQFKVWDHAKGDMITQPLKSPLQRIVRIGGDVIPGTAEDVDVRLLDEGGRYDPKSK